MSEASHRLLKGRQAVQRARAVGLEGELHGAAVVAGVVVGVLPVHRRPRVHPVHHAAPRVLAP